MASIPRLCCAGEETSSEESDWQLVAMAPDTFEEAVADPESFNKMPWLHDPIPMEEKENPNVLPLNCTVAVDGKISIKRGTWGVGMIDLNLGVGHFSGGKFSVMASEILKEGVMDQGIAEALAVQMALDWVRKRQVPDIRVFASHGYRPLEREPIFVTDKTTTLTSLQKVGDDVDTGCTAEFLFMLNILSMSIVKMLSMVNKLKFIHKRAYEGHYETPAREWAPDRLAAMGVEHGNIKVKHVVQLPTEHLLKWTNHDWYGPSLLQYVEVELVDTDDALALIGAPSSKDYLKFVCKK